MTLLFGREKSYLGLWESTHYKVTTSPLHNNLFQQQEVNLFAHNTYTDLTRFFYIKTERVAKMTLYYSLVC